MRLRFGSRRVRTPSGTEWRVARQWCSRGLPRWRRVRIGEDSEQALGVLWSIPPVDVGGFEGIEVLLAVVVAAVVIVVIAIPLLLFGIELILAGLLVAAGIVARSMFGRPWIVLAASSADPDGALAWEVKGWRRSGRLIDQVVAELAGGHTPSPIEDPERSSAPPGLR
jgi:hypothetical protein